MPGPHLLLFARVRLDPGRRTLGHQRLLLELLSARSRVRALALKSLDRRLESSHACLQRQGRRRRIGLTRSTHARTRRASPTKPVTAPAVTCVLPHVRRPRAVCFQAEAQKSIALNSPP
eukprot:6193294-Pleurochrysis_carterae.AAC.2